jgi:hypothetical protein
VPLVYQMNDRVNVVFGGFVYIKFSMTDRLRIAFLLGFNQSSRGSRLDPGKIKVIGSASNFQEVSICYTDR